MGDAPRAVKGEIPRHRHVDVGVVERIDQMPLVEVKGSGQKQREKDRKNEKRSIKRPVLQQVLFQPAIASLENLLRK